MLTDEFVVIDTGVRICHYVPWSDYLSVAQFHLGNVSLNSGRHGYEAVPTVPMIDKLYTDCQSVSVYPSLTVVEMVEELKAFCYTARTGGEGPMCFGHIDADHGSVSRNFSPEACSVSKSLERIYRSRQ